MPVKVKALKYKGRLIAPTQDCIYMMTHTFLMMAQPWVTLYAY